ncbi:MAG: hypothetical protein NVSMB29_08170 [Candidatus Dormibacteria bacterium]
MRSDAGQPTVPGVPVSRRLQALTAWSLGATLLVRVVFAARSALDGAAADYVAFATGARVLASGSGCLYCLGQQTAAQISVLGYRPPSPAPGFPAPYANPPLAAWVLQPLARLPLQSALPLFVAAQVGALFIAAALLLRLVRVTPPERSGLAHLLVPLAALSLPGATAVLLGQWDPLILLALAGALVALAAGRDLLAGLAASLILVKPQLGVLLGIALVITGRRRLIGGFGIGVGIWVTSTLVLVGPAGVVQWAHYVDTRLGPQATYARGLAGLAAAAGGDARAVELSGGLIALGLVAGALVLRRRLRANPDAALALGVAASLCCTPHVFSDDMLLLAPALVIWGTRRPAPACLAALALNLAFLLDEYLLPARLQRVEGLVALAVVIGLSVALSGRSDAAPARSISTSAAPGRHPVGRVDPHNEPSLSPSRSLSQCPCAPSPLLLSGWP